MILRGGLLSDNNVNYSTYTALPANDFWFDVATPTVISRQTVPGGNVATTTYDCNYNTVTNGTYINDYQLNVVPRPRTKNETITVVSSNDAVAYVENNGTYLHGVSGGTVTVTYSSPSRTVTQSVTVGVTTITTSKTFTSWVSGSLAESMRAAIDPLLISGKSSAIFSTKDHATATYVYNTNCWAYSLSKILTSNSVWNSNTNGGQKAGTLISPRHIIFAAHYEIPAGSTVRFVKMDGTVVTRTVTAIKRHPDYVPYYPDITIGLLDSDVPSGINFCKVLPNDIYKYLPTLGATSTIVGLNLPVVFIDQEEKALIEDLTCINNPTFTTYAKPTDAQRLLFYEEAISGDSGSPVYTIINGDAVLLSVTTFSNGNGTSISNQYAAINALMSDLGGGYQLTPANLSGYSAYL